MKNINDIVRYMRRRSEELTGLTMVLPISKPLWDHIVKMLESHCLKTGLPIKSGDYLCLGKHGNFNVLHYSERHKAFNCRDEFDVTPYKLEVIAWCELPEIPGEMKHERVMER